MRRERDREEDRERGESKNEKKNKERIKNDKERIFKWSVKKEKKKRIIDIGHVIK